MIYKLAVLLLLCTIGCSRQDAESELSFAKKLPTASPPLGSELHENSEDGFSIYLPAGWGAISDEALAAQGAAVSGPEVTIEYLAGYQVVSNDLFVHPFVLVRKLPDTAMPREKIKAAQQLMLQSGNEIAQRVEQNSGLQLNMELGVPVLEKETGIVWLKFQLDGTDAQRVEGIMAHYYVDGHILQFIAGTTKARAQEDWTVLEQILRTIQIHSR
ncbi:hypothetical protein NA78x_002596 [Anatilimnocola sp. NA78]|uniref:hypothetical protein n=1 Tax=Anatilimnocola sp. NA78 TaxID=3415683 RepID=UPI003CE5B575